MMTVSVGNGVWWCILVLTGAVTYGLYRTQKDRTNWEQRRTLLCCGFVVFGMYFLQRIFMFRDPLFWELYGSQPHPMLINLLPLHLCYSGLMLTMVGLYKGYRPLMGFGFYAGLMGAFLAMVSPDAYYDNHSLVHLPTLFFYLTHGLLVAAYACIGLLELIQLNGKTAAKALLILVLVTLALHGINTMGALVGLDGMNYCYTVSTGGSGILELLWSWLPIQWIYVVLPGSLFFAVWAWTINGLHRLWKRRCANASV